MLKKWYYTLPMWRDKSISMFKPQTSIKRAARSRTVQFFTNTNDKCKIFICLNAQQGKNYEMEWKR